MLLYITIDAFTVTVLVLLLVLSVIVANVGRKTALGYWGHFDCLFGINPVDRLYSSVDIAKEQAKTIVYNTKFPGKLSGYLTIILVIILTNKSCLLNIFVKA
jgi:hypothetical protein